MQHSSDPDTSQIRAELQLAMDACNQQVLGNPYAVKFAFIAFLAGGHLLIEDLPGLGKTTLARTLAKVLGLSFKRVQFTTDLLPSDIIGVSIFNPEKRSFEFHRGAVFTSILLADEINRAPPRTQSALLEAMAESRVTVTKAFSAGWLAAMRSRNSRVISTLENSRCFKPLARPASRSSGRASARVRPSAASASVNSRARAAKRVTRSSAVD